VGPAIFSAADIGKDGSLTRAELRSSFAKWFGEWDTKKSGALDEEAIGQGFNAVLPLPEWGGPGRGAGRRGGQRGPRGAGFGGGPGGGGITLDPLVAVSDSNKPLISKLLAVPSLRSRYLGYVRDIADKWLDWKELGARARQYQALLADEVKADTRKLSSLAAFQQGVDGGAQVSSLSGPRGGGSLKSFAEQRRAYLLKHAAVKDTAQ
jgi:hypothetical protein